MRYDTLKALLKKNGSSLTQSRQIIFDLLLHQKPQTMQRLIKRADGLVDRATTYRTIELFEQIGIVHRLNIGWKYKLELSDAFHAHHHHFYCTKCSKTFSLPENVMLETMIDSLVSRDGFSPRGHTLEVSGLCANCQRR
jgi:Fur family ferric uptake transcriptional regulator